MDSKEFDTAIEAVMVEEIGKVNGLLPMVDVKNMMKIKAVVDAFIEQVKKDPDRGNIYPGINWGDFGLVEVAKVIPLSGDIYFQIMCEEASSSSSEMIQALYNEVREKLGVELDVRLEW